MRYLSGDWLEIAKKLPQGRKIRTLCSEQCGTDNSQLISHDIKGYHRYCFRCKASCFEPHGEMSIETIERHRREREYIQQEQVKLPDDYSLDVPDRAALWYYKVGISAELAKKHWIGYSEYFGRVVLPVFEDGTLTALQMRAVYGQQPKYLNPTGPSVSAAIFESGRRDRDETVVVEDILSAIKGGRVTHFTSILGTNMTDQRALKIAAKNKRAAIWLDGDGAGKRGMLQAERQLQMLGVDTRRIITPQDPKTYSLEDIRRILND